MRFQLTQYFETTIFVQLKNFSDFSIDDYFRGLDEFVSLMDILFYFESDDLFNNKFRFDRF